MELHTKHFTVPKDPNALITTAELAAWMRWKRRTADDKRRTGEGPPYISLAATRGIRYRVGSVLDWLEGRQRTSTSDTGEAAA